MLLAATATAVGFAYDAGTGDKTLSGVFSVCYVIGCLLAVLAVRQSGVFSAVIQPPLILFFAVPTAYFVFHGSKITGIKDTLINCGYPLIERFPLMFFTTAVVLLIGMGRWYLAMSARRGAPVDADAEVPDAAVADRWTCGSGRHRAGGDQEGRDPPRPSALHRTRRPRGRRGRRGRDAAASGPQAKVGHRIRPRVALPARASSGDGAHRARAQSTPQAAAGRSARRATGRATPSAHPCRPAERPSRSARAPGSTGATRATEPAGGRSEATRGMGTPAEPRGTHERSERYDRPQRPERPERSDRYERGVRPERRPRVSDYEPRPTNGVNGSNGSNGSGSHHPVSRVRYRGADDGESRTENRSRPRRPSNPDADSWQYDV